MFPSTRSFEDAGVSEDPAVAHVQRQLPAVDHRRRERAGEGTIPARDPSVSVSEKRLGNSAFQHAKSGNSLDLLHATWPKCNFCVRSGVL